MTLYISAVATYKAEEMKSSGELVSSSDCFLGFASYFGFVELNKNINKK